MYLTKKAVGEDISVKVIFEKIVDDLLMISLTNQTRSHGILSYWRLVKVSGIPPLEIGVDCERKSLASINFCIDSTYIKKGKIGKFDAKEGSILIDTSIFSKTNDYIDIAEGYTVCIKDNKLSCLFGSGNIISESYRTARLEVYLDAMCKVVGFAICDLSMQEKNILNSL